MYHFFLFCNRNWMYATRSLYNIHNRLRSHVRDGGPNHSSMAKSLLHDVGLFSSSGSATKPEAISGKVTSNFGVAWSALQMLLSQPVPSLSASSGQFVGDESQRFSAIRAFQELLRSRSAVSYRILVPRNVVEDLDGFVPYFLGEVQRRMGTHSRQVGRDVLATTEMNCVDQFRDFLELFVPEKDHETVAFPQLLGILDAFFTYLEGGVDCKVPIGSIAPYYGSPVPSSDDERRAFQKLFHFVAERAGRTIFSAIDAGCGSGYVTCLLAKAGVKAILATDDRKIALENTKENLGRLVEKKSVSRSCLVDLLKCRELLPVDVLSKQAASDLPPHASFEAAARQRRRDGRLVDQRVSDTSGHREIENEPGKSTSDVLPALREKKAHVITLHDQVPPLFDHPLLPRNVADLITQKTHEKSERFFSALEANTGVLHPSVGLVATVTSNYHSLLLGHLEVGSDASAFARRPRHALSQIAGWEVQEQHSYSLSALGSRYLGNRALFDLIESPGDRMRLRDEVATFYERLQNEFVVLKPKWSQTFAASLSASATTQKSSFQQKRDCVAPCATNADLDFEDTFEHNFYLPRDGTGNPFHFSSAVPTFSFLDPYDSPDAKALRKNQPYVNLDPADSFGRLPRSHLGLTSSEDQDENQESQPPSKSPATQVQKREAKRTFDILFNRESRLAREKKWHRVALEGPRRQDHEINERVLNSAAAKLQVLNELSRFKFNGPKN